MQMMQGIQDLTGINKFKQALSQGLVCYQNKISELLLKDSYDINTSIADKFKYGSGLFASFTQIKNQASLEYLLYKIQKPDLSYGLQKLLRYFADTAVIITDNNVLEGEQMPYHVALLDATEDYVLNYYPENVQAGYYNQKFKTIEITQKCVGTPIQCLVFIKDDGSYFGALPCFERLYLKGKQSTNLPVITTSLKQIKQVLEPSQSLKIHQVYMCRFMSEYALTNADPILNTNTLGTKMGFVILGTMAQLAGEYEISTNRNKFLNSKSYQDGINSLFKCTDKIVFDYLSSAIKPELNPDGSISYQWPKANQFWQELLKKYEVLSLPYLTVNNDGTACLDSSTPVISDQKPEMLTKLFTFFSQQILMQMPHLINEPEVTDISDNQTNTTKPLINSKGLATLEIGITRGKGHKYYLGKDDIYSFYGDQQITHWLKMPYAKESDSNEKN